jgi:hypothetical protein
VAGGHVSGIYSGDDYFAVESHQLRGYQGTTKHRKFKTLDFAWKYLELNRDVVDEALERARGRRYLPRTGKPSTSMLSRQSATVVYHTPTSSAPQSNEFEVKLTAEQAHVVDLILAGVNIFYTGCAGCESLRY